MDYKKYRDDLLRFNVPESEIMDDESFNRAYHQPKQEEPTIRIHSHKREKPTIQVHEEVTKKKRPISNASTKAELKKKRIS